MNSSSQESGVRSQKGYAATARFTPILTPDFILRFIHLFSAVCGARGAAGVTG